MRGQATCANCVTWWSACCCWQRRTVDAATVRRALPEAGLSRCGGTRPRKLRLQLGTLAQRVEAFERETLARGTEAQSSSHDEYGEGSWVSSAAISTRSASSWGSICARSGRRSNLSRPRKCRTVNFTATDSLARRGISGGWREQPQEKQVCREIDNEDEKDERDGEVRRSGSVRAMQEGIVDGEIQILIRGDEARSDQDGHENRGLQFPAATVVAEPAE